MWAARRRTVSAPRPALPFGGLVHVLVGFCTFFDLRKPVRTQGLSSIDSQRPCILMLHCRVRAHPIQTKGCTVMGEVRTACDNNDLATKVGDFRVWIESLRHFLRCGFFWGQCCYNMESSMSMSPRVLLYMYFFVVDQRAPSGRTELQFRTAVSSLPISAYLCQLCIKFCTTT